MRVLVVVCLWIGVLQGAAEREPQEQRIQKSRYAIMLGKLIQEATKLPNDPCEIVADYDDGFWPLKIEKVVRRYKDVSCLSLIGQRCLLVANTRNGNLRAFDLKTDMSKKVRSGHKKAINCLVHRAGFDVATASSDRTLRFWNMKTGETHHVIYSGGSIKSLTLVGNNALVGLGKFVYSWGIQRPRELRCNLGEGITSLLPIDDRVVALGKRDGKIYFCDAKTGNVNSLWNNLPKTKVVSLARLPSGEFVSVNDSNICVVDMKKKLYESTKSAWCHFDKLVILDGRAAVFYGNYLGNQETNSYISICNGSLLGNRSSLTQNKYSWVKDVAAAPTSNFFAVNFHVDVRSKDAEWVNNYDEIHVFKQVGDEVPEEKIDDEFVEWMSQKKNNNKGKKKPWYVCG